MCGRYALYGPASLSREAKAELVRLGIDLVGAVSQREPQYNIAPTQRAPVLARGEAAVELKALHWGLVPIWAKDTKIGSHAINARSDTVADKPMFRTAFKKRRCMVPASGYFEWKGEAGAKQPYLIHDPAGDLLLFAGLWEAWRPIDDEAAEWYRSFTIITGEPGKVSGDIHDRQPVILQPDAWETWLDGTPQEAADVIASAPEAALAYYPVPKAVGSPRNKGPELVQPIEP
jgi:putative SOS response-associated peptidase YedK